MNDTAVGALIALSGVLVGLGATIVLELRRWAREDRLRFHDKKLAACAEFYSNAKLLIAETPRRDRTETLELRNAMVRSEATISFLAGPDLQKATYTLQLYIADAWERGVPDRAAFYREANKYLNAFKRAVRLELGTPLEDDVAIQEETTE